MGTDTMRVTGAGCVIIGPEGHTPPLPFVTIPTLEAESLIERKLATAYTEEGEAEEPAPAPPPPPPPPAPAPAKSKGKVPVEHRESEGRAEVITEALDLMEDGDLVTEGERTGKPEVKAMAEATGFEDITAEEIDAAIAAKDSAE